MLIVDIPISYISDVALMSAIYRSPSLNVGREDIGKKFASKNYMLDLKKFYEGVLEMFPINVIALIN